MKFFQILILAIIISSCSKEEEPVVITPDPIYGDIEIEVVFCEDPPSCTLQSAAVDAQVFIYNSEMLQLSGNDESRSGLTGQDGKIRFNGLDVPQIYISVVYKGTQYRSIENVPQNSLSFHRVDVF